MRVNSSNLHFRKDYSGLLCSEKNGDMSDQKPRKWAETVHTHAGELQDAVRPEAGVAAPAGWQALGHIRCRLPRNRMVWTVSRFSPAKAPLPAPPRSLPSTMCCARALSAGSTKQTLSLPSTRVCWDTETDEETTQQEERAGPRERRDTQTGLTQTGQGAEAPEKWW